MGVFTQSVPRGLREKLYEINWALVLLIVLIGMIGVGMLYSVEGGQWDPYASRHAVRFAAGFAVMLTVALAPPRLWMGLAYPAYLGALVLLVGVEFFGSVAMGEEHRVSSLFGLLIPVMMIAAPVLLVSRQPDLGTSVLIAATGLVIVFLAGLSWRVIGAGAVFGAIGVWGLLQYGLKDYQRERIFTFLDPEADPLGAGYQIMQSKIALGSGGMTGKGYMEGSQAHLNYLPEKQTDFIFTMLGEEFGFVGCIVVLGLYAILLMNCLMIAASCKSTFLRLVVMGVASTFAFYVFINAGMVMGLFPVVGVPLPMISYGGSVMMTVLIGLGLILGAHVHRGAEPPKGAGLFG